MPRSPFLLVTKVAIPRDAPHCRTMGKNDLSGDARRADSADRVTSTVLNYPKQIVNNLANRRIISLFWFLMDCP